MFKVSIWVIRCPINVAEGSVQKITLEKQDHFVIIIDSIFRLRFYVQKLLIIFHQKYIFVVRF